jgi:hypothetical protein
MDETQNVIIQIATKASPDIDRPLRQLSRAAQGANEQVGRMGGNIITQMRGADRGFMMMSHSIFGAMASLSGFSAKFNEAFQATMMIHSAVMGIRGLAMTIKLAGDAWAGYTRNATAAAAAGAAASTRGIVPMGATMARVAGTGGAGAGLGAAAAGGGLGYATGLAIPAVAGAGLAWLGLSPTFNRHQDPLEQQGAWRHEADLSTAGAAIEGIANFTGRASRSPTTTFIGGLISGATGGRFGHPQPEIQALLESQGLTTRMHGLAEGARQLNALRGAFIHAEAPYREMLRNQEIGNEGLQSDALTERRAFQGRLAGRTTAQLQASGLQRSLAGLGFGSYGRQAAEQFQVMQEAGLGRIATAQEASRGSERALVRAQMRSASAAANRDFVFSQDNTRGEHNAERDRAEKELIEAMQREKEAYLHHIETKKNETRATVENQQALEREARSRRQHFEQMGESGAASFGAMRPVERKRFVRALEQLKSGRRITQDMRHILGQDPLGAGALREHDITEARKDPLFKRVLDLTGVSGGIREATKQEHEARQKGEQAEQQGLQEFDRLLGPQFEKFSEDLARVLGEAMQRAVDDINRRLDLGQTTKQANDRALTTTGIA